jgi:hypothetical protein
VKTAVDKLIEKMSLEDVCKYSNELAEAKLMEKDQAQLYAEFAILSDRSGNPVIPFNEFINIDNL